MRLTLVMLALLALAGYATPPDPDQQSVLLQALDAITHGQWWLVAGAALTLVHIALTRWTPVGGWWWFGRGGVREDAAKVGLAAILAITGGIGHVLLAGGTIDLELLTTMAKTFIAGTTFFVVPKKLAGAASQAKRDAEPPFPGGPT